MPLFIFPILFVVILIAVWHTKWRRLTKILVSLDLCIVVASVLLLVGACLQFTLNKASLKENYITLHSFLISKNYDPQVAVEALKSYRDNDQSFQSSQRLNVRKKTP
jgi:hypothetical protein